jgi:hypothetical protein
MDRV